MGLRVVGAGTPRTGTESLKHTLERLLGAPCYHMHEYSPRRDEHWPMWMAAFKGDLDQLDAVLADWTCAVDWPASAFWRELAERHPDALVVLSVRDDSATWWASADRTVWEVMRHAIANDDAGRMTFNAAMRRQAGLGESWDDEATAKAWYEAHVDEVIATVPPERLLVWHPADGYGPIAERLGVRAPDDDPIHMNTTGSFRERAGFDD